MRSSKWSAGIQEDIETSVLLRKRRKKIAVTIISVLIAIGLVVGGFYFFKSRMISVKKAESIALNDSSFSAEEVINLNTRFSLNGIRFVYNVSFRVKSDTYEYTIFASSGEIADKEISDNEDAHLTEEQDPFDMKPEDTPSKKAVTEVNCTKSEAKEIVLNAADVKKSELDSYICEINKYNHYAIRFVTDGKEYQYELDFDGNILKDKVAVISDMKLITKEEALEVAFDDAGVTEKDARNPEVEYNEASATFKVKFTAKGTDFKYTIDSTGGVLDYNRGVAVN